MKKIIQKLKNKEAFTLIEMLIVLFIIAILLILIIPNITKNIDTAKDKSSEAYEKTVQSQVTAYEINEKDKDVTFEKLVEKHYLDGPADKASTAPNGKKIVEITVSVIMILLDLSELYVIKFSRISLANSRFASIISVC